MSPLQQIIDYDYYHYNYHIQTIIMNI